MRSSAHQNEHSKNAPSSPCNPSGEFSGWYRHSIPPPAPGRSRTASAVARMRGSPASTTLCSGRASRLASTVVSAAPKCSVKWPELGF